VQINGLAFESTPADIHRLGSEIGSKAILDYLTKRKIAKGMNAFMFRRVD
jgi:hypothetical protein